MDIKKTRKRSLYQRPVIRRQQSLEISPKRLRRRSRRVRGSLRRPRRLRSQRDLTAAPVRRALAVVVPAVLVS